MKTREEILLKIQEFISMAVMDSGEELSERCVCAAKALGWAIGISSRDVDQMYDSEMERVYEGGDEDA